LLTLELGLSAPLTVFDQVLDTNTTPLHNSEANVGQKTRPNFSFDEKTPMGICMRYSPERIPLLAMAPKAACTQELATLSSPPSGATK
jgi:hypothetical protein